MNLRPGRIIPDINLIMYKIIRETFKKMGRAREGRPWEILFTGAQYPKEKRSELLQLGKRQDICVEQAEDGGSKIPGIPWNGV